MLPVNLFYIYSINDIWQKTSRSSSSARSTRASAEANAGGGSASTA
jgi:hypothetical protein